jgi:hypothetical protein
LEAAIADVDEITVQFNRPDQHLLAGSDVQTCKAAFSQSNISIVPNDTRLSGIGDLAMFCDGVKRARIAFYERGIYRFERLYFRLKRDDVSTIISSMRIENGGQSP